ncbi:MAG TPA: NAD(P)H-dependent oxidoreductase subunit E [Thermoclostridium sp.]|nr:NAD(P)H-dependent oxidoreductase subunit E [Thermoclostridium sp.]
MKITVCIGSSCHLKGSRIIVEKLQSLIAKNNLNSEIDLSGVFCMGNCTNGVCLTVDEETFSLKPDVTEEFFTDNILSKF